MEMKMMAKKTMIWCTLIMIIIFLIINIILIFSPLSSSPESNWSFAITASDPLVHLQPCSSNWVNIAIINCTIIITTTTESQSITAFLFETFNVLYFMHTKYSKENTSVDKSWTNIWPLNFDTLSTYKLFTKAKHVAYAKWVWCWNYSISEIHFVYLWVAYKPSNIK